MSEKELVGIKIIERLQKKEIRQKQQFLLPKPFQDISLLRFIGDIFSCISENAINFTGF